MRCGDDSDASLGNAPASVSIIVDSVVSEHHRDGSGFGGCWIPHPETGSQNAQSPNVHFEIGTNIFDGLAFGGITRVNLTTHGRH